MADPCEEILGIGDEITHGFEGGVHASLKMAAGSGESR
jgi:hypothetical protein